MNRYTHLMDRRDPNYMSEADESRQEINELLERKSQRERCATWIGGRQCDNFTMPGSKRCAVHGKGTAATLEP